MFFYPKMVQKLHIWEIYGSLVMAKMLPANPIAGFFDHRYLWKELF